MRGKTYYKIDSNKLREQLDLRKLPLTKTSQSIGYSHAYLSNTLRNGKISMAGVKLLQAEFNIQPDSYLLPSEETEKAEKKPEYVIGSDDFWKKAYQVFYGAVYQAMKRALSE